MRRLFWLLCATVLSAQVMLKTSTIFTNDRSLSNNNSSWLQSNKSAPALCALNLFAVQTTSTGFDRITPASIGAQDLLGFRPENIARKNQPSGYAGLDANGKILTSQVTSVHGDVSLDGTAHIPVALIPTQAESQISGQAPDLALKSSSASPTFAVTATLPLSGSVHSLHVNSAGAVAGSGAECGSGGGGGANSSGSCRVSQAANARAHGVNPGARPRGLVKIAVVPGVAPVMNGTGTAGAGTTFSRADHVHPSYTTKQAVITGAPGAWPAAFPPRVHTHAAADVISANLTIGWLPTGTTGSTVDATGPVTWSTLTGKPATFAPSPHAAHHQSGGADEIATATAAANAIPKAGVGGTLAAAWIPVLNQPTTSTSAGLTAQYIDWSAVSGGASIAHKPTIPVAANTTPAINGSATPGSGAAFSRADHVHPTDTTRQSAISGAPGTWPATFSPSAHAASHAAAGSDPLTISASQVGSGYHYGNLTGAPLIPTLVSQLTNDSLFVNPATLAAALATISPALVPGEPAAVPGEYVTLNFNFTPIIPDGSPALTAGVTNTVTITPVPLGVNGTDVGHTLMIYGGVGTYESIIITGGTAVSGAASGTITFIPAYDHSGPYIVESATLGTAECVNMPAPVSCYIPPGNYIWYGKGSTPAVWISQNNVTLRGAGPATVLNPNSYSTTFIGTSAQGFTGLTVKDMSINAWNASPINSVTFLSATLSYGIRVSNITAENVNQLIMFDRVNESTVSNCVMIDNTTIFIGSTVDGGLGYSFNDTLDNLIHYPQVGFFLTTPVIRLSRAVGTLVHNVKMRSLEGIGIGISIENDSQNVTIEGGTMAGPATGVQILSTTVGSTIAQPLLTNIDGGFNVDAYTGYGISLLNSYFTRIDNVSMTGGSAGSQNHAIYVSSSNFGTTIQNSLFQNIPWGNGITVMGGTQNFQISNNQFSNQVGMNGYEIYLPSGLQDNYSITGNVHLPGSRYFIANGATGTHRVVSDNKGLDDLDGAISSAATIQPATPIETVTGATAIVTINLPGSFSGPWTVIAGSALSWTASGNITAAGSVLKGKSVIFSRDANTGKWTASI